MRIVEPLCWRHCRCWQGPKNEELAVASRAMPRAGRRLGRRKEQRPGGSLGIDEPERRSSQKVMENHGNLQGLAVWCWIQAGRSLAQALASFHAENHIRRQ